MIRRTMTLMAGGVLLAALLGVGVPAAAQGKKIVVAIPGIPPIYSVTIAFVAEKQGFFKKHGVDVEIRPFDNGTAAARAVVAGDIDMAWSPTPPVINQVSNADVPLAAVYGMPNPDWVIGTTE
ncbi:MAG: ABC transporter substrate-binding protein, partial [Pseudolabrys sp.]